MGRSERDETETLNKTIKFNTDQTVEANGTANVSISNVAPAGVGTATITKWLTVRSSNGTLFYIPMWT